jgi:predicted dinucleotide-binding enzyme
VAFTSRTKAHAVAAAENAGNGAKALDITTLIEASGDDPSSKENVRTLITRLGFDAVDAGPLSNARYLEPLSLLNIHLGRVLGFGTNIGFSLLRPSMKVQP